MTTPNLGEPRPATPPSRPWGWPQRLLFAAAAAGILIYLLVTPDGLLAKADIVGYAICHRIPSHSLLINGRPLPLCARCTGTYLGSMLALGVFFVFRRRSGEIPPIPILLILLGFTALMGIDGLNSYMTLLPFSHSVYEPHNWLRLLTGSLNGLMMGSILYPVVVGALWRDYEVQPVLRNVKELGLLVLAALAVDGLALTGWPAVLAPLALLSSAGVVVMLTLVNTVLVVTLFRREGQAQNWRDLVLPLLAGLALSVLLLGSISLVRYGLTGTLSGMPGLPQ